MLASSSVEFGELDRNRNQGFHMDLEIRRFDAAVPKCRYFSYGGDGDKLAYGDDEGGEDEIFDFSDAESLLIDSVIRDDKAELVAHAKGFVGAAGEDLERSTEAKLLHLWCNFDSPDCAAVLLGREIGTAPGVNDFDDSGKTALHTTALAHSARCVDVLLKRHARTVLRTRDGRGQLALDLDLDLDLSLSSTRMNVIWNSEDHTIEDLVVVLGEKDLTRLLGEKTKETAAADDDDAKTEKRKVLLLELELVQLFEAVAQSGCTDKKVTPPLIRAAQLWIKIFKKWFPCRLEDLRKNPNNGHYALPFLTTDFKAKFGLQLDYKSLGFSKLSEFVKSFSNLFTVKIFSGAKYGSPAHMAIQPNPRPRHQLCHTFRTPCFSPLCASTDNGGKCLQDISSDDGGNSKCLQDISSDDGGDSKYQDISVDDGSDSKCHQDISVDGSADSKCLQDISSDDGGDSKYQDISVDDGSDSKCHQDISVDGSADSKCLQDPSMDVGGGLKCLHDLFIDNGGVNFELKPTNSGEEKAFHGDQQKSAKDTSDCVQSSFLQFLKPDPLLNGRKAFDMHAETASCIVLTKGSTTLGEDPGRHLVLESLTREWNKSPGYIAAPPFSTSYSEEESVFPMGKGTVNCALIFGGKIFVAVDSRSTIAEVIIEETAKKDFQINHRILATMAGDSELCKKMLEEAKGTLQQNRDIEQVAQAARGHIADWKSRNVGEFPAGSIIAGFDHNGNPILYVIGLGNDFQVSQNLVFTAIGAGDRAAQNYWKQLERVETMEIDDDCRQEDLDINDNARELLHAMKGCIVAATLENKLCGGIVRLWEMRRYGHEEVYRMSFFHSLSECYDNFSKELSGTMFSLWYDCYGKYDPEHHHCVDEFFGNIIKVKSPIIARQRTCTIRMKNYASEDKVNAEYEKIRLQFAAFNGSLAACTHLRLDIPLEIRDLPWVTINYKYSNSKDMILPVAFLKPTHEIIQLLRDA